MTPPPLQHDTALSPAAAAFDRLFEVVRILRAPGGCPWDREQTPLSLRKTLVEETFETVDAITENDAAHAKEEIGDVLLNATMLFFMYEEHGDFSTADAINELTDKLIRRHPHVFQESPGNVAAAGTPTTGKAVLQQWEAIKETVEHRVGKETILDEVPRGFPPLLRAYKLQKKAANRGFDWQELSAVREKVREELAEVDEALCAVAQHRAHNDAADERQHIPQTAVQSTDPFTVTAPPVLNAAQLHLEEEIGDVLFALVNYARHAGVDPEIALHRANEKFYRRFSYVEQQLNAHGIPLDSAHLNDADAFWDKAKALGL